MPKQRKKEDSDSEAYSERHSVELTIGLTKLLINKALIDTLNQSLILRQHRLIAFPVQRTVHHQIVRF